MYVLATYLALVLLATPLHATLPIFILYASFSAVVLWTLGTQPGKTVTNHVRSRWIALTAALFAILRLIPFMRWGWPALGADMGAYYRNFNACFASIAACAEEPLALLGYLPYAMGAETQTILIVIHLAASALLMYGVWRITKREWGARSALFSIAVYAVSLPQFLFYWSFFLKMEIALALTLFALDAYARGQKRAAIYAALAGIVHPLTIVPLTATIILTGITSGTKRYSLAVAATGAAATAAFKWNALYGYAEYLVSYATGTYAATQTLFLAGHFVEFSFYHDALMLFYVPFALTALAWGIQQGTLPAIGWYALVNLILISVNAVFHNRFVVLFDISCVILGGYAFAEFSRKIDTKPLKSAAALLLILIAGYSLYESVRMEPLVNAAEFRELTALQGKHAGMPLFINSTTYRQFVLGYTEHPVIVAPFNEAPWEKLGTPSLIYNARRSTPINPENNPHFTRISERIFEYRQ